jgi:hypothetical protein
MKQETRITGARLNMDMGSTMEVFFGQGRRLNDSAQRSASNECVRLIRKLRWIGMDDEAERVLAQSSELTVARSNPRSLDKAPYARAALYFTWGKVRVEPNYCLAKLVGTWNYGVVRHNDPLTFDEDAIFIVLDIPFAVIERVTIGSRTAIQSILALQRLKPRLQWIARPLTGWIADQDNGGSE